MRGSVSGLASTYDPELFGIAPFDKAASVFAAGEIANLVRVQFRPKLVLLEILQILTRRKIEPRPYLILYTIAPKADTSRPEGGGYAFNISRGKDLVPRLSWRL
jgi:hypothetical protein